MKKRILISHVGIVVVGIATLFIGHFTGFYFLIFGWVVFGNFILSRLKCPSCGKGLGRYKISESWYGHSFNFFQCAYCGWKADDESSNSERVVKGNEAQVIQAKQSTD